MIQRNWGTEITEKPQKIVYTTNKKKNNKKKFNQLTLLSQPHIMVPCKIKISWENDTVMKLNHVKTLKKKSRKASKTSVVKTANLQDQWLSWPLQAG